MKDSWRSFFRRMAVTTVVSGSVAWSSAMCYATQLAFDSADDPVYADGWQGATTNDETGLPEGPAGDNGGFGFEPWNFDTDYIYPVLPGIQAVDDGLKSGTASSSTFNDIGRAWRIAMPAPVGGVGGIPRAGRGFPTLQVGQTMRVVVDNPIEGPFFKGYFIGFNSRLGLPGGGNVCYGDNPCQVGTAAETQTRLQMFEYYTYGNWSIVDGLCTPQSGCTETTLYDTDKVHPVTHMPVVGTDMGMRVDLTMTGTDTYDLTMTPLDNPGAAFLHHGVVENPGDGIDWFSITFFNQDVTDPGSATDFYIRSLEIFDNAVPAGVTGDYNNDKKVNAADYTVWRNNLGGPGTSLQHRDPANGSGPVSAADYTSWKTHFGEMAPGSGSGGFAVPEPGTFVYFVAAGLAGLAGLRNGKGQAHENVVDSKM